MVVGGDPFDHSSLVSVEDRRSLDIILEGLVSPHHEIIHSSTHSGVICACYYLGLQSEIKPVEAAAEQTLFCRQG